MFFKNFFIGIFLIFSLNFCYSATNEKNIINQESTNESSLPQKKKNKHNTSISNDDTLQQSDNQQFTNPPQLLCKTIVKQIKIFVYTFSFCAANIMLFWGDLFDWRNFIK